MDHESALVVALVSAGITLLLVVGATVWLLSRLQATFNSASGDGGRERRSLVGREWPLEPVQQAYRVIVVADIERFGRPHWDDRIRVRSVHAMSQVFAEAFRSGGIPPERWHEIRVGDALLLLVEPEVGTANVLRTLLDCLPAALSEHNRLVVAQAELRLRVLLHAGHVMLLDDQSAVGVQLNLAFRLLDAEPLRQCLCKSREPQVMAVSQHIFEQVVRHRPLALDPDEFEPMLVEAKETVARLWVHLPGYPNAGAERAS